MTTGGEPLDHEMFDPRYVVARRVLLDALFALKPHGAAFIVVGAQAVYLDLGDDANSRKWCADCCSRRSHRSGGRD